MLRIKKLPKKLVIIGGGFIGVEFASIFRLFGSEVTILDIASRPIGKFPKALSDFVLESFAKRKINFLGDVKISSIEKSNNQFVVNIEKDNKEEQFEADVVLIGTGRVPNIDNMDLKTAGVEYSNNGVKVDEFLQTTNPNIYAAGDVAGGIQLTSTSNYTGELATSNAFTNKQVAVNYNIMPMAIYSEPPVAIVGEDIPELKNKGINAASVSLPFSKLPRARTNGETEGFIKIIFNKDNDRILGAQIAGENADDLIHTLAVAIKGNLKRQDIAELKFFHPSLAEGIRFAARQKAEDH